MPVRVTQDSCRSGDSSTSATRAPVAAWYSMAREHERERCHGVDPLSKTTGIHTSGQLQTPNGGLSVCRHPADLERVHHSQDRVASMTPLAVLVEPAKVSW